VLRFLLLFLDSTVDSPHSITDCRRRWLEGVPLFQLADGISDEPELTLLQAAEGGFFVSRVRMCNVFYQAYPGSRR
jgi:hypothetical protein